MLALSLSNSQAPTFEQWGWQVSGLVRVDNNLHLDTLAAGRRDRNLRSVASKADRSSDLF